MNAWFVVLAGITIVGAAAAMMLRSLVHCALALALAFTGIGTLYLYLGAQFLGLAQLLVYVGAIAVLIVFVILLTRGTDDGPPIKVPTALSGILVAVALFGVLAWAILHSHVPSLAVSEGTTVSVRDLGTQLMTDYILPLEIVGVMLTAALIGAVIVAMKEKQNTQ
jgi:NADH:ubiquinone oxidoreductase subunit 6 (subunit J)